MNVNKYNHSGKLGYAPLLLPLAGIPLIIILSCIYAYITVYNPIGGYITFLILLGYTIGVGMIISFLGKAGKCRNNVFLGISGLIGGILGLYFSWVFFLYALLHSAGNTEVGVINIILHPGLMWETIGLINETGWFTIKGATPSGIFLWLFWGIEAAVILLGGAVIGSSAIDNEMFCEKCNVWCEVSDKKHLKIPEEFVSAKTADVDPIKFAALEPIEETARPCIKAEMFKCGHCINKTGWRYFRLSTETDNKGNVKDKSESFDGIVLAARH